MLQPQNGRHTLCPAKRYARSCGLKFHTMTQLSSDPETSCFMVGLKTTLVTASLWPLKDLSSVGSSGCTSILVLTHLQHAPRGMPHTYICTSLSQGTLRKRQCLQCAWACWHQQRMRRFTNTVHATTICCFCLMSKQPHVSWQRCDAHHI